MPEEADIRSSGAGLITVGLLALIAGLASLGYEHVLTDGDPGLVTSGVYLSIGGLIVALLGSMLLLLAPDTLPPEERGDRPDP